jgi:hypothetical protein
MHGSVNMFTDFSLYGTVVMFDMQILPNLNLQIKLKFRKILHL